MCETEMEFTKNTLYVALKGNAKKSDILELKRKLYRIIEEYMISQIVIDMKSISSIDKESFYDFLDEYDEKYHGNLEVLE